MAPERRDGGSPPPPGGAGARGRAARAADPAEPVARDPSGDAPGPGTGEAPALSCPVPIARYPQVLLAHGGGGRLMHALIEEVFGPGLGGAPPGPLHDGVVLPVGSPRVAFTTDSYVVRPLFFPGGDIGSLAVNGTVNDLAMCGARPLALSAGFILEEGFAMGDLGRVVLSMGRAAREAGVGIVTGDTKVVERGRGDGLYVNTAGIGVPLAERPIGPAAVRPGDAVLLSGDIARHGMAILAAREELGFESAIESDCAPLHAPVIALLEAGIEVRCLRDATRGGVATTLVEIARGAGVHVRIEDAEIEVRPDVRAACELLGFDPLYVANEGRFVAFVPEAEAERALAILRAHPVSAGARRIGAVAPDPAGLVTLRSRIGATRVVDMMSGEQLPRIC